MDQEKPIQADATEVAKRLAERVGQLELDLAVERTALAAAVQQLNALRAHQPDAGEAMPPEKPSMTPPGTGAVLTSVGGAIQS